MDTSIFSQADIFNAYYETVSEYRKNKIDKLKLKGKENSLAVEILLQKALDKFEIPLGIEQRKIEVSNQGKPFLLNYPNVYFNLSHAGNRALCIISDKDCGCDVEQINPKKFNLNLVKRFFSQKELELIEAADESSKTSLFFDFWTRKESFGKMTGEGVNYIIGNKTDFSNLEKFQSENACFFKLYDLQDGYKYACCSKNKEFSEIVKIDINSDFYSSTK